MAPRAAHIHRSHGQQFRPAIESLGWQSEFGPAQNLYVFRENLRRDNPPYIVSASHVQHDSLGQLVAERGRQKDVGVDQHIH